MNDSSSQPTFLNQDTVVREYKSLVVGIANSYKKSGLAMDDLIQEGLIGLLQASKKFDADRNVQFSTYATYWIKKYILLAISSELRQTLNSSHVDIDNIPDRMTETRTNNIVVPGFNEALIDDLPDNERQILILSYKHNKTIKEIATLLNLSQEKVKQLRTKAVRRIKSKKPSELLP